MIIIAPSKTCLLLFFILKVLFSIKSDGTSPFYCEGFGDGLFLEGKEGVGVTLLVTLILNWRILQRRQARKICLQAIGDTQSLRSPQDTNVQGMPPDGDQATLFLGAVKICNLHQFRQ